MNHLRGNPTAVAERHARVKLEEFALQPLPDDRCAARVALAWATEGAVVGTAECEDTPRGQLRCAAEATAQALELATRDNIALTVLSVTALEPHETVLVVVSLASQGEHEPTLLVGSCLLKPQRAQSAVLAVLSATNRLVGSIYSRLCETSVKSGGTRPVDDDILQNRDLLSLGTRLTN